MRKHLSFLLVYIMLVSLCGLAFAAPISNDNAGAFLSHQVLNDGGHVNSRVLTREEVIQRIMQVEDISYTEAELRLDGWGVFSREELNVG